jgi:hypothetical protein
MTGASVAVARNEGVWRIAVDGSGSELLAPGPIEPLAIATNGSNIDILEPTRIITVDASGGVSTVACFATEVSRKLASDSVTVLWTGSDTGAIYEAPR